MGGYGGSGLLGIIGSLVGNVTRAQRAKHQEESQYWGGLAQSLAAAASNPNLPPDQRLKAQQYMWDTFAKHGGKEGKQIAENMTDFLQQAGQKALVQQIQSQGGQVPTRRAPAPGGGGFGPPTPYLPGATPPPTQAQPPQERPWPLRALAGVGGGLQEAFTGAPAGNVLRGYPAGVPPPQTFKPTPEQEIQRRRQQYVQAGGESGTPEQTYYAVGGKPALPRAPTAAVEWQQYRTDLVEAFKLAHKGQVPTGEDLVEIDKKVEQFRRTPAQTSVAMLTRQDKLQAAADKLTGGDVSKLTAEQRAKAVEPVRVMSVAQKTYQDALQAYADAHTGGDIEKMTAAQRIEAEAEGKRKLVSAGGTLTADELHSLADLDLRTGKTTNFGLSANNPMRIEYQKERAKIIKERGAASIAEQQAELRADSGSLSSLTRMTDAVDAWENNAKKNLEQARMLSKQVGRTGSTLANEYLQWAQGKLEDYPLLARFRVAVETGAAEYTKVMYSATPSGGTAADQREQTKNMLSTGMGDGNLNGAIDQMYIDMDNRHNTMHQQIGDVQGRMKSGGSGGGGAAAPSGGKPVNPKDPLGILGK